jgi:hypothetical protein
MQPHEPSIFLSLLPFAIASILYAIGNYFLARRLGKSPAIWLILSLIPFINLFFIVYILYAIIFRILDYLKVITDSLKPSAEHLGA